MLRGDCNVCVIHFLCPWTISIKCVLDDVTADICIMEMRLGEIRPERRPNVKTSVKLNSKPPFCAQ